MKWTHADAALRVVTEPENATPRLERFRRAQVHAVVFGDGDAPSYSRSWLRTEAFVKEEASPKFYGSLVAPYGLKLLQNLGKNFLNARQPQKDTANTAMLPLTGGRVLGLMEQCKPCEFQVFADGRVETTKAGTDLDGGLGFWSHPLSSGALTAHLHNDPKHPGEAVGVTYASTSQPYARLDVVDLETGTVKRSHGVELRAPVMVHDCALAGDRVVVFDLPLTVRPERMLRDAFPVAYVRRADIAPMNRVAAAAATWIFREDESRRRRGGRHVDIQWRASKVRARARRAHRARRLPRRPRGVVRRRERRRAARRERARRR